MIMQDVLGLADRRLGADFDERLAPGFGGPRLSTIARAPGLPWCLATFRRRVAAAGRGRGLHVSVGS